MISIRKHTVTVTFIKIEKDIKQRQRARKQRDEEAGQEAVPSTEESYVDKDRAIVVNSGKI